MGDPRKQRKKYKGPSHPWVKDRIEAETILKKEFGLANKREIYKANTLQTQAAGQAKKLVALRGSQAEKETGALTARLKKLGMIKQDADISHILALSPRDILERRLQTQVFKKMMANTAKQARQMITHGHIMVNNKKITSPNYLVSILEESTITYAPQSAFANEDHPERQVQKKSPEKIAEEAIKKSKEGKRETRKPIRPVRKK